MNVISELFSRNGQEDCIVADGVENNVPYCIKTGVFGHYCAYVAVPREHALYGVHYDDITIRCNGGPTYSDYCNGWWIIGWDYGHMWNLDEPPTIFSINAEILDVIDQLSELGTVKVD